MSRAAKIASAVGAIAGAVIAVGTLWTMLDLPVLATRSYVDAREAKANDARSDIVATVIELARDQRDRLKRARDVLTSRLTAATDAQARADLQLLVEQANQDIADVDSRITTLERMRGR